MDEWAAELVAPLGAAEFLDARRAKSHIERRARCQQYGRQEQQEGQARNRAGV